MNIIQAIKDENLFRTFMEDSKGKIDTWNNWFTAMKVVYGLGIKPEEHELIRKCTGRDPLKLPDDGFRTALFLCGRRSGKSRAISVIASFEATLAGNESKLSKGEMGMVVVVSPTQKQSRVVKNYIRAIFDIPLFHQELVASDKWGFELSSGTRVEILSGDWKTVRSFSTLAVVVDEVCFMGTGEDSKVKSDTELIRALDPSRATTGGKLIAISSPYAEKGWAYNSWKKNWGNDKAKMLVWRSPSRLMNPTLPQSVIDEAIEEDEAAARAEYLAEWRTDVATWLTRNAIEETVAKGITVRQPDSTIKYSAFVDISGGRVDDSALSIAHREKGEKNGPRKVVLDFCKRWKAPHSPKGVISVMADTIKAYNCRKITGDNYSADFVKNEFEGMGIRYEKSEKNKSLLYLELLPLITSKEAVLLDDDILVTQLAGLERRTRVGGRDSVDHAPNHKDDLANAVAGAIVGAASRKVRVGAL